MEREKERRKVYQQTRSFLRNVTGRAFCVVNGLSPIVTLFGRFCSARACTGVGGSLIKISYT